MRQRYWLQRHIWIMWQQYFWWQRQCFCLYGILERQKSCGYAGAFYAGMGRRRRYRMPEAQQAAEWLEQCDMADLFLIYVCFNLGYDLWIYSFFERTGAGSKRDEISAKRILICIFGLMAVSIACFTLEAVVVGYIPLFNSAPHAYSYFHISGVHYFTISCILIPALTVLYTKVTEKFRAGHGSF